LLVGDLGSVVEFRVLGPLEVERDGHLLELGGAQQRTLLAVLLLHRNEVVSSDRLIDELWGERPPVTAAKTVQVYVSRLRKALGDGVLLTRSGGYLLVPAPGQVDADRFQALVSEGHVALQAGDAQRAAVVLTEALALWRGPALADFAYRPFAQSEIARLAEARLAALEDRIDAELALGEHVRLVEELEKLVGEHPLRERLRGQLMLALYRSGRQAEALESYHKARGALVDDLGIEPGRALQELERAILEQDRALDLPSPVSVPGPTALPARVWRGALAIAAAGALLLAGLVAAAVNGAASGTSVVRVAPNSVAVIDVGNDRVVGAVPVGTRPGAITVGAGSLWVANQDDQTVSRVDPGSLRTLHVIPVGETPTGIAASRDGIWVAASDLNLQATSVAVTRIDPEFNALGPTVRLASVVIGGPGGVAAQGNSVWVSPSAGFLTRLDATTGQVAQRLDPNATPAEIAIGYGAIWATDTEADDVIRVDPTGRVTAIAVGNGPGAIAVGAGGVWVADALDNAVVRIDPSAREVVARIPVGRSPAGLAVGGGSIWVADRGDGTVTRIDPRTDRVRASIAVGGSPQAITIASKRAWVTVDARPPSPPYVISDGGTLRLESLTDVDSMDPALAYEPLSDQLLWASCAQLVIYPDEAGQAGSLPIPDVAQALPTRSADGRTYTFRIRQGFRFSPPSNQQVTAQTFKDSIERTLNPAMHSPMAQFLADIVGASAYMARKAHHISGILADGNTLTIRLVAPAPNLLFRLAFPGFCAVPTNTPVDPRGVRVIPSAGPYYVASYTPGQGVVLLRNPNYHGRRPRHFERIELAVGISAQRAVADIESGRADYTNLGLWGASPRSLTPLVAELAARYGSVSAAAAADKPEYLVNPILDTDWVLLNTHRPLFGDVRARLAANYAIDRRALAALVQPAPDRLTDQYLPPGIAGFREAHIYPLTPDLAKARQLMHSGGRSAVLYTCNTAPCPEQAQIVKTDLAGIGLHVQIKTFPWQILFTRVARPDEPFDLLMSGYRADYPDPQGILNPVLADSSVVPTLNDKTYLRRLAAAARLSGPERYLTYGRLDLDLARNVAPLIAYGNQTSSDFFAARIGCQTFNSVMGMDLGALCVRHPAQRH
jgi:YVTN family beta-propeller protein